MKSEAGAKLPKIQDAEKWLQSAQKVLRSTSDRFSAVFGAEAPLLADLITVRDCIFNAEARLNELRDQLGPAGKDLP